MSWKVNFQYFARYSNLRSPPNQISKTAIAPIKYQQHAIAPIRNQQIAIAISI
ncbi:hypothetical protein [Pseudanabaena sp. lw0831]|uniref:hypothetical protein n=1 Tax=Pseudanabaena sp. lw0831 TaxID=1357935 RepID=UPI0019157E89|nr:hypothetical protein [Pseudanabaena sp. lw0831]